LNGLGYFSQYLVAVGIGNVIFDFKDMDLEIEKILLTLDC
jgi:hypothetical protein